MMGINYRIAIEYFTKAEENGWLITWEGLRVYAKIRKIRKQWEQIEREVEEL